MLNVGLNAKTVEVGFRLCRPCDVRKGHCEHIFCHILFVVVTCWDFKHLTTMSFAPAFSEALAEKSGDDRFAYDSYRRLYIQMYADVVLGIDSSHFEKMLQ